MVKLLLARDDVDKSPVDNHGNTPLLLAGGMGERVVIDILLEMPNANVWHRNHGNNTALALAAQFGHEQVVKRLLEPALEVTADIVRDAMDSTQSAAQALRKLPIPTSPYPFMRARLERRVEKMGLGMARTLKLLTQYLNSMKNSMKN